MEAASIPMATPTIMSKVAMPTAHLDTALVLLLLAVRVAA